MHADHPRPSNMHLYVNVMEPRGVTSSVEAAFCWSGWRWSSVFLALFWVSQVGCSKDSNPGQPSCEQEHARRCSADGLAIQECQLGDSGALAWTGIKTCPNASQCVAGNGTFACVCHDGYHDDGAGACVADQPEPCLSEKVSPSGCLCGGVLVSSGYCCDGVAGLAGCAHQKEDADQDGFEAGEDCDDHNPRVHPGALRVCGNSRDDDCSGIEDRCLPCAIGAGVPEGGCLCNGLPRQNGFCCNAGWQGFACDYTPRTCAQLGVPNCVEVWPGEQREGYKYEASRRAYFFPNLSNVNHYYLLMGDLTCDATCAVFGFQAGEPSVETTTTFDLNGHTLRYSAAAYGAVQNQDFESWTNGKPNNWTVVSGSVEARSTSRWMPMHGDYTLYAPKGATLVSSLVSLPVARAYHGYLSVGRADESADLILEVLDEAGSVRCSETKKGFFRGQTFSCRFDTKGPGSFRLRITMKGEAYIDSTGLVPLNDYGVAVLTAWSLASNNPYQDAIVQNLPGFSIPASGDHASPARLNHLEIKNGSIIAEHENQKSVGVRLTGTTSLNLHGVTIQAQGIKSHSVQASGDIHGNHLEVDMPWYFAREASDEENVILGGGRFYDNVAVGGQGVVKLSGQGTEVYGNYLQNNAQATNHYAIIHAGAVDPSIHDNVFDPIEGSGILTYVGHGYRIFNNTFHVRTAPCNVEYINEDYSTNGIRMNDYGAGTNYDNQVFNNIFYITGRDFQTEWPSCMPVTTGIFYSASGKDNRIHHNRFYLTKTFANDNKPVFAFYIGGKAENHPVDNPLIIGNYVETNDQALWIATYYGGAADLWLEGNTFVRVPNAYYTPTAPEAAMRMGYYQYGAPNTRLINNRFVGGFEPNAVRFTASSSSASYSTRAQWYLQVTVRTSSGTPVAKAVVRARSSAGNEDVQASTDDAGRARLIVTQYVESGDARPNGERSRVVWTPHEVIVERGTARKTLEHLQIEKETTLEVTLDP